MIKLPNDDDVEVGPSGSSSSQIEPLVVDVHPEEPPPEFAPYEAEYFTTSSGNIVSHDPHLNTDGEALYRFLLAQSLLPPRPYLHCKASHDETRVRTVYHRDGNGNTTRREESYTETIIDFDFMIDVSRELLPTPDGPIHWSAADSDPVFRGRMFREIENHTGKYRARRGEVKKFQRWGKYREGHGLPPWAPDSRLALDGGEFYDDTPGNTLMSSKTLREWADEYCASPKHLKEFTYRKVVYGWDLEFVQDRVQSLIRGSLASNPFHLLFTPSSNYNIHAHFHHDATKIHVRPSNRLSRLLSKTWVKVVLWILLIYPFIWLFKRFHRKGGGRWEVCGGAWAITRYEPFAPTPLEVEESSNPKLPPPGYDESQYATEAQTNKVKITRDGRRVLRRGTTEEEWLARWEGTITRAVRQGYQSNKPVTQPWLLP
ncbi:hypothetical protein Moror_7283 [Moniliophthora roreri MCA 2997]|uniref:Uncharacterized protein n=1 Tax=Moniliophthora roreri (strain MCA 2997) TaxID=1381753 RepID=V2XQZ0_MONRO|nr:hypothetical protein Moror_7283 [Moniliophthora roreri MCA 2997]